MNNAIEAYRKRRMDRLKTRGACFDEIGWITVENGEHVPIENGVSVGGWSKGKDFSRAKSSKSVPKGTEKSSQRVSRALKGAKDAKSATQALKGMKKGDTVHLVLGNRIISYKKTSEEGTDEFHDQWTCVGGEPYYSPFEGRAFSDQRNVKSGYFGSTISNHKCFGSLAAAKKEVSKTFPSKNDAGRLEKVTSLDTVKEPSRWIKDTSPEKDDERVYRLLKNDPYIRDSEMGTKTFAIYNKSISKSKELNDYLARNASTTAMRIESKLKDMGIEGQEFAKADDMFSRDSKGNLYVSLTFKEKHGKGKKATYRTDKYKIDAYANKRSYVNSNGDVVAWDVDDRAVKYKLTLVSSEK